MDNSNPQNKNILIIGLVMILLYYFYNNKCIRIGEGFGKQIEVMMVDKQMIYANNEDEAQRIRDAYRIGAEAVQLTGGDGSKKIKRCLKQIGNNFSVPNIDRCDGDCIMPHDNWAKNHANKGCPGTHVLRMVANKVQFCTPRLDDINKPCPCKANPIVADVYSKCANLLKDKEGHFDASQVWQCTEETLEQNYKGDLSCDQEVSCENFNYRPGSRDDNGRDLIGLRDRPGCEKYTNENTNIDCKVYRDDNQKLYCGEVMTYDSCFRDNFNYTSLSQFADSKYSNSYNDGPHPFYNVAKKANKEIDPQKCSIFVEKIAKKSQELAMQNLKTIDDCLYEKLNLDVHDCVEELGDDCSVKHLDENWSDKASRLNDINKMFITLNEIQVRDKEFNECIAENRTDCLDKTTKFTSKACDAIVERLEEASLENNKHSVKSLKGWYESVDKSDELEAEYLLSS